MKARIEKIERVEVTDTDPDLSWLDQTDEQMGEGFERHANARKAQFGDGWWMIGIRARATIKYATSQGGWIHGPVVESSGLWGIESDSDNAYLNEVYAEQLSELIDMLRALGFHMNEIMEKCPEVES